MLIHQIVNGGSNNEVMWYEVMCDEEIELTGTDPDHLFTRQAEGSLQEEEGGGYKYFCLSVGELGDFRRGASRDWFLVLKKSQKNQETYERVGIGYYQYLKREEFPLFDFSDIHSISLF
jgi:hypothetical protein